MRCRAAPQVATTDSGPDEIVRRDHGLDRHRLGQTEYRAYLRLHRQPHASLTVSPPPNDPMQVDVPRECAPPNPFLSSPRFRTDRDR